MQVEEEGKRVRQMEREGRGGGGGGGGGGQREVIDIHVVPLPSTCIARQLHAT